jgi:hypothetical protein
VLAALERADQGAGRFDPVTRAGFPGLKKPRIVEDRASLSRFLRLVRVSGCRRNKDLPKNKEEPMSHERKLVWATRLLIVLLTIAAVHVAATEDASAADTRHGVITIVNPTHLTINYSFKWGDGQTQSYSLAPGQSRWHSWPFDYPGQNRTPTPTITFDSDMSFGTWWSTFRLQANAAAVQGFNEGNEYYFEIRGGSLTIVESSF